MNHKRCLPSPRRQHHLKEHTCQGSQFDAAGDVVIEGDLAIGAVAFSNGIHSLWTQPEAWGRKQLKDNKKTIKNNHNSFSLGVLTWTVNMY